MQTSVKLTNMMQKTIATKPGELAAKKKARKDREEKIKDLQKLKEEVQKTDGPKELFEFEVNEMIHQTKNDVKDSGIENELRDNILDRLDALSKRLIQSKGRVETVKTVDDFLNVAEMPVSTNDSRSNSLSPARNISIGGQYPTVTGSMSNQLESISLNSRNGQLNKNGMRNAVPNLLNTAYRARTNVQNTWRQIPDSIYEQTGSSFQETNRAHGVNTSVGRRDT
jgi:hypothetical protein